MMDLSVRSQSVAQVLQGLRDVPARIVPYATSAALTRSALAARDAVRTAMLGAFDRPSAYTINSLFVVPSTAQTLRARVHVKNVTTRGGTLPENYLLPEVEGGARRHKRMETALRYAGWLPAGWFAVTTRAAAPLLDENGNLPASTVRSILLSVGARQGRAAAARRAAAQYFAVAPADAKGRLKPGIYKRQGARSILPIVLFTAVQPKYRPRLDFAGVAQATAERTFPGEFARALAAQLGKGMPA